MSSSRALLLLLLIGLVAPASAQPEFERATAPHAWSFPADHGSHPEYSTEWWYFTGSLVDGQDQRFGYELTFFRVALRPDEIGGSEWRARDLVVAHFTVTEVDADRFHRAEAVQRAAMDLAGARTGALDVWLQDWRAWQDDEGTFHLRAREDDLALELSLTPTKGPVLHGENGLSRKNADGSEASHYVTLPRLRTEGRLVVEGQTRPVSGMTWMDHEFFTGSTPAEGLGWDWFSARLADGRDLMIYRVHRENTPPYDFATLVRVDGSSRPMDVAGLRLEPLDWWTSPDTGNRYPVRWRVTLPAEDLRLEVEPALENQEMDARASVGFSYWEGLCFYTGSWKGRDVAGEGYVELTGYGPADSARP